jgi:signal transduction histidine kinase
MHHHFFKYVFCLTICLLLSSSVLGQNNPYKINDELYHYYLKNLRCIKSQRGLDMCDTLFAKADKMKETKAQCIAYYLKALHYYDIYDMDNLRKMRDIIYRFTLKLPYKQYYFGSWNLIINLHLINLRYSDAEKEITEYRKAAIDMNSPYGLAFAQIKLGELYYVRRFYTLSIREYKKSLSLLENAGLLSEMSSVYAHIGMASFFQGLYEKSVIYDLKALATKEGEETSGQLYALIAACYYNLNNNLNGNYYYDQYNKWEKKYKGSIRTYSVKYEMCASYYMNAGNYQKALLYCDSINSNNSCLLKSKIYEKINNYKLAYESLKDFMNKSYRHDEDEVFASIARYSALYDNERLRAERDELALKNSTYLLEQLQERAKFFELDKEKNSLLLSNARLALTNNDLQIKTQKANMAKQQLESQRLKEKAHELEIINQQKSHNIFLLFLLIVMIIVSTIVYIILRRRNYVRLVREKKAAEQARNEAIAAKLEAERADKMKSVFLQNMSHEIRTPLNAIVGFSNLLADTATDDIDVPTKEQYAGLITSNSDMLTTLLNDILDLSELESGSYKVNYERVSLNNLCNDLINSVRYKTAKGVTMSFASPASDFMLITDRIRTRELLMNYLTNAAKYTKEGSIVLTYKINDTDVEFSVTDTGVGISPDNADKIFKRFEKLNSFVQGTGIGLNICSHIANILHGKALLDTSYKEGSRFLFVHPILEEIPNES